MAIQKTNRILCLPGGGMRGYFQSIFIDLLIQHYNFATPFHSNFDVICGTSIGCINALGLVVGKTPSELSTIFTNEGRWIFTIRNSDDVLAGSNNASEPSNRPNAVQQADLLIQNDPFYRSVSDDSNYGHVRLYNVIDNVLGDIKLNELENNVLLVSFDTTTSKPVLFSNFQGLGYIGHDYTAAYVAKASSAAPVYLPVFDNKYSDGGLAANDPSAFGVTLGKRISSANYENVTRNLVLTVGTGSLPDADWSSNFSGIPFVGTGLLLSKILKATLSGSNTLNANDLYYRDKYTLDDIFQYQANPVLDNTNFDPSLDNTSTEFLNYMYNLAYSVFNSEREEIDIFMEKFFA
jgi:predicted acylesterase/phospholipase RssA